jgi:cob(I)alamin adenosyltransferase
MMVNMMMMMMMMTTTTTMMIAYQSNHLADALFVMAEEQRHKKTKESAVSLWSSNFPL